MAKLYRSREGEATAVDTKTQLTTLMSDTAPGPLLVPANAQKIVGVMVSACDNSAAADGAAAFVRLEGPGLPEGPESFAAGAFGQAVATGTGHVLPAVLFPVELEVVPSNEILVFGEMVGGDIGQVSFVVTLVFET